MRESTPSGGTHFALGHFNTKEFNKQARPGSEWEHEPRCANFVRECLSPSNQNPAPTRVILWRTVYTPMEVASIDARQELADAQSPPFSAVRLGAVKPSREVWVFTGPSWRTLPSLVPATKNSADEASPNVGASRQA